MVKRYIVVDSPWPFEELWEYRHPLALINDDLILWYPLPFVLFGLKLLLYLPGDMPYCLTTLLSNVLCLPGIMKLLGVANVPDGYTGDSAARGFDQAPT
jgi:hypothetical protein